MIIAKSKLMLEKTIPIQKEFAFDDDRFLKNKPLLGVTYCLGDLEITKYHDIIRLNVDLKVKVLLECSYTLEAFIQELVVHEQVLISDSHDLEDDAIFVAKDEIDLDLIIFSLIAANIPIKPIKPGAKLPESGKGYRVLDDEQLAKDRRESGDARFAKLNEIDFDDEEN